MAQAEAEAHYSGDGTSRAAAVGGNSAYAEAEAARQGASSATAASASDKQRAATPRQTTATSNKHRGHVGGAAQWRWSRPWGSAGGKNSAEAEAARPRRQRHAARQRQQQQQQAKAKQTTTAASNKQSEHAEARAATSHGVMWGERRKLAEPGKLEENKRVVASARRDGSATSRAREPMSPDTPPRPPSHQRSHAPTLTPNTTNIPNAERVTKLARVRRPHGRALHTHAHA